MGKKNEKEEKQVQDVASEEKVDKKEAVDTTKDIENLKKEVNRMYSIVYESIELGFDYLLNPENNEDKKIINNEDIIDKLNEGIIKHVIQNLKDEMNVNISNTYRAYLSISSNVERISDHIINIYYEAKELREKEYVLSEEAIKEINNIKQVILDMANSVFNKDLFNFVKTYENSIDELTEEYKNNTFNRMKTQVCAPEGSIIYSTLLINFERIGDHLLNVSEENLKINY